MCLPFPCRSSPRAWRRRPSRARRRRPAPEAAAHRAAMEQAAADRALVGQTATERADAIDPDPALYYYCVSAEQRGRTTRSRSSIVRAATRQPIRSVITREMCANFIPHLKIEVCGCGPCARGFVAGLSGPWTHLLDPGAARAKARAVCPARPPACRCRDRAGGRGRGGRDAARPPTTDNDKLRDRARSPES